MKMTLLIVLGSTALLGAGMTKAATTLEHSTVLLCYGLGSAGYMTMLIYYLKKLKKS